MNRPRRLARLAPFMLCALLFAGCATQGNVDQRKAARANADLGADALAKGRNDHAQEAFQKALHYDRNNFTANWGMAVVSERLNQPDDADRYFKKALSIRSEPSVYNSYAAFLCGRGDTSRGVANFRRAAKTANANDRADSLANAGLCLYRAERASEAVDEFKKALKANPKQETALTQLASMAYHAHDYMNARAFIERADDAGQLDADDLLLAARIELALNDRSAAAHYLKRHNAKQPAVSRSLGQLESSRQ